MVILQTIKQPTVIHAIGSEPRWGSRLSTTDKHAQFHEIPEETVASGIAVVGEISAVQYELTKNRESQMARHQVV